MTQWNVLYPVSLNLRGRRCVIVGERTDREAIEKYDALVEAGGDVVWLSQPHEVREADVRDAFFVISTPQDIELSKQMRVWADRHRFLLCCIDQPEQGFVAMAAIVKSGPVRIAISTAGLAPRVGKVLKEALQGALDSTFARFIDCLATQRTRVKRAHPGAGESAVRRGAMIRAAEGFTTDVRVGYPQWFHESLGYDHPTVVVEESP